MSGSDKNRAIIAETIAKTFENKSLRSEFLTNPKQVLKKAGANIPDSVKLNVLESTENIFYVVLPPAEQNAQFKAKTQASLAKLDKLTSGKEVRIVRNSAKNQYIVLPPAPSTAAGGKLSDESLEKVAGGKASSSSVTTNVDVATSVVSVQTNAAVTTVAASAEVGVVAVAVIVIT
jgi:hypothetical protein